MSIFDHFMRALNRYWVATNWGPRARQDDGTSCPRHGGHTASREYGA